MAWYSSGEASPGSRYNRFMAAVTGLTIDDFERLPEVLARNHELVDGELEDVSGDKPQHNELRDSLVELLRPYVREHRLGLSLRHSQTALGAYYRKLAQRLGGDVAVFATARKLATLIYRLLRWGQPYVDEGAAAYENRYLQQRSKSLTAKAKQLGYELTAVNA